MKPLLHRALIRRTFRFAGVLLAGAVGPLSAQSTYLWTNTVAASDWNSATNWSPNAVPNGIGNLVYFTGQASAGITVDNGMGFTNGTFSTTNAVSWIIKAGAGTNWLQVASGTPVLNVSSGSTICWFEAAYLGGNQGFNKTGAGKVTFRYDNNTNPLTGTIGILGGALGIQADFSLGNTNNGILITNGATLTEESSANSGSFWLAPSRVITLAGTQAVLSVAGSADILGIPGLINENSAGSGLLWNGAGELILSNANTFTGPFTMTAGTNDLANANAVQFSTLTESGGILLFDQAVTGNVFNLGGLAGTGNIALQNNAATPAPITLTVGGNNAGTVYSGILGGPGSFVKTGTGTLTLGAPNVFGGATSVRAGTLALAAGGAISNSASITVSAGATLDVSAMATFNLSSNTALYASGAGTISGATAAVINGGGAVNLGARPAGFTITPAAFAGDLAHPALLITNASLTLSNNAITISNATATALGAGVYRLIQVGNGTGGSISGTPNATPVAVTGAGLATNTAATLTVAGGDVNLAVNLIVPLATTNTLILAAGSNPSIYGNSVTFQATVSPAPADGETVFFKDGSTVMGTSTLAGGVVTLAISNLGAGSHSISAVYPGDSTDAASTSGVLAYSVNQAIPSFALSSSANPGGYLTGLFFTAALSTNATGGVVFSTPARSFSTNTLAGGVARSLSLNYLPVGSNLITAVYSGDGNYLPATNFLSQAITNYPPVTVTWTGGAGDNNWGTAGNWNPALVPNSLNAVATFTNAVGPTLGSNSYTVNQVNFSGGESTLNGTGALMLQTASGSPVIAVGGGETLYFYSLLGGTQGYTKTGTGTLTFRYSGNVEPVQGPIIVSAGTLGLQDDFSLGNVTNTVILSNNATLSEQNSANGGAFTLGATRSIFLAGGSNCYINTANAAETLTVPGPVSSDATGGFWLNSPGLIVFSGSNSYVGPTTLGSGELSVGAANNLGAPASVLNFAGGTLQITGTRLTNFSGIGHAVSFTGGATVGLDISNATNFFTADAVLNQGAGGLTKLGPGTLALSQTNTFSGVTAVSAGTLALVPGGSLNNTASLSLTPGSTLDVSALGSYALGGSTTLIASGNATNAFLNGPAGGTVSLGTRPVTLSFDGYDPALVISQGTLALGGQTFTVNSSVPLSNGTYNLIQVTSGNMLHSGTYRVAGNATNGATGSAIVFSTNAGIAYVQLAITGSSNSGIVTTTMLSSNETDYGTASGISATVSPGTAPGAVQFYVDGTAFGSPVPLAGGSAAIPSTLGLPYGIHTVTASYPGAGLYFASSNSNPVMLTIVNVAVAANEADAFELWLLHNQNQFPNDYYLAAAGDDGSVSNYVANLSTNGSFLDITNYPAANSGYVLNENGSNTGWLTHLPRLVAIYSALINTNSSFYVVNNSALATNLLPKLINATRAYVQVPWDITDEWNYCHTWADLVEGYALGSVCLYSRQLNRLTPGLVPVSSIDAWGNRIPDLWRNGHIDTTYMTPPDGAITTEHLEFQVTGGNMVWTSQGIVLKYLTQSTNSVRLEGLDATFQHFWTGCALIGAKHEAPPGWPVYEALPQMAADYMLGEHDTPYLLLYGGAYLNGFIQCRNDMFAFPRWSLPPSYGVNQLFANCVIEGVAPLTQGYPDRVLLSRDLTSSTEYSPTDNLNSWLNDIIGFNYRTNELRQLLTWNNNNNPGTNTWPFTNHTFTHYYTSDYSCQHYPNYLVTFRGVSRRTTAIENLQNPLAGYFPQGRQVFVPLGGSYIYANGNEYGAVSYNAAGAAAWQNACDYTRIPGVTTKAVPDSAFTNYWRFVYGDTPFAGTAAANNSGVSGWEQSRNVRTDQWTNPISLAGNSAVFYLDMAVVHLGAGFDNSQDTNATRTSMNQCLSATNTITYGLTNGMTLTITSAGGAVTNAAINWALYQGVGYLPPTNGVKVLGDLVQNGAARVFSFYDDQSSPVTANLAFDWEVLPGVSQTTLAAYATPANRPWVIVTNTAGLQALAVPSENWLGAVFHTNGATLYASNLTVSVSRPTVLLITMQSNQVATIYAADPYENMVAPYTNTVVPFTNSAQLVSQVILTINGNDYPLALPPWPYLGKTVSATVSLSSTNRAPFITSQPVGTNLPVGGSAVFTVAAPGLPLPNYQWLQNGTIIPGATGSTFSVIAGLVNANAGFSCVITNSVGSVTSNPALLAVSDAPVISGLADQAVNWNTPAPPQFFTVSDSLVPAAGLSLSVVSSNTTLVPNANIILGGNGTNWTLAVIPATNQTGYALINVLANNGVATTSQAFLLTVATNPAAATNLTWTGNGGDNVWSDGTNWGGLNAPASGGDGVVFAGTTRLTPILDSSCSLTGLTFSDTAGSFCLTNTAGSGLALTGNVVNDSTNAQTVAIPLVLAGPVAIDALAGNLTVGGTVVLGGNWLTLENSGFSANIAGTVSGSNGVTSFGSGTNILSGTNLYLGLTLVKGGTLWVNGGVGPGGVLVSNGATLGGTGWIAGSVLVTNGGTLAPGNGGAGILAISNNLSLAAGAYVALAVSHASATNGQLRGVRTVNYGGTLAVTNLAGTLANNDSFQLFSATNYTGNFATIRLPTMGAGLAWSNRLVIDGSVRVVATLPVAPTNITANVSGASLTISWPASYTGWVLQAQTNTLGVGLANNWATVAGSSVTNRMVLPVNPADGTVFYRLAYP